MGIPRPRSAGFVMRLPLDALDLIRNATRHSILQRVAALLPNGRSVGLSLWPRRPLRWGAGGQGRVWLPLLLPVAATRRPTAAEPVVVVRSLRSCAHVFALRPLPLSLPVESVRALPLYAMPVGYRSAAGIPMTEGSKKEEEERSAALPRRGMCRPRPCPPPHHLAAPRQGLVVDFNQRHITGRGLSHVLALLLHCCNEM